MSFRNVAGIAMLVCASLTACRTVASTIGDRDAVLRTGQWWAGPIPDATPIKPQDRTAWVSYKNVTQEQSYDLRNDLRRAVESQGYKLTEDPDSANFQVFYTLRFFGENSSRDEGRSSAAMLGAIAGGVIARSQGGNSAAVLGATAGGGMVGAVVSNFSQVIEYNLIMDVRIAQRKKALVTRTTTGVKRDAQRTASSGRTDGGTVAGGRASQLDTKQQMSETDNMLWQENRLVLWAKQIRLNPEEARPTLGKAMVSALPQLLP